MSITVNELGKTYGGRNAIEDVTFRVDPGQIFALLGPNGAGKTTTIEILEGLRDASAGQARVLDLDPRTQTAKLRPRIGVMLQEGGVYPAARVGELIRTWASYYPSSRDPRSVAELVGIDRLWDRQVRQLSGGEHQRMSLALALIGNPEVLFLDEPTSGMDPRARSDTWKLIRNLRADQATILLATHLLEEAEAIADSVGILYEGKLVKWGPLDEMRAGREEVLIETSTELDTEALRASIQATVQATERGLIVMASPTPSLIRAIAEELDRQKVLARRIVAGDRSLEELYLELTDPGAS